MHAETLLRAWPWKRRNILGPTNDEDASQIVKEAHKYGLRAISKARWDALNEEYLLYKQALVNEMARTQPDTDAEMQPHPFQDAVGEQVDDDEPRAGGRTTPGSSYPFDCLVFVRNVHPETNKTTLKALFGHAFQNDLGRSAQPPPLRTPAQVGGAGLDYVDFTKGMDTVRIRIASQIGALAGLIGVLGSAIFVSRHRTT